MLKKIISLFGFVVFFVSLLIVMIHHEEIDNGESINKYTFSQVFVKLREYNNSDELGQNYLNSLTNNLNQIKIYLKGNYLNDAGSITNYLPSSIIQNDLLIKQSDNFFERIRLSLSNGANYLRSWLGFENSSNQPDSLDKALSFFVGFIPTISAVSVCAFQIGVIGLNYITIFCDIVL